MKKYKNLVLDVGGVLIGYRWRAMLQDYGLSPEEAERVGTSLFEDPTDLWNQLDYGIRPREEILEEFVAHNPGDEEVIRWFLNHGEYMHVPRPRVWRRVHELKEKGYRIFLLSNYSEFLFSRHTQYADFMEDLDGMMVSYMVKDIKPHAPIYQALWDRYDLRKEECIFFDDRLENVEASIALGMDAKQVLSQEGLLKDLAEL